MCKTYFIHLVDICSTAHSRWEKPFHWFFTLFLQRFAKRALLWLQNSSTTQLKFCQALLWIWISLNERWVMIDFLRCLSQYNLADWKTGTSKKAGKGPVPSFLSDKLIRSGVIIFINPTVVYTFKVLIVLISLNGLDTL